MTHNNILHNATVLFQNLTSDLKFRHRKATKILDSLIESGPLVKVGPHLLYYSTNSRYVYFTNVGSDSIDAPDTAVTAYAIPRGTSVEFP